jgi:hypothetical protein
MTLALEQASSLGQNPSDRGMQREVRVLRHNPDSETRLGGYLPPWNVEDGGVVKSRPSGEDGLEECLDAIQIQ